MKRENILNIVNFVRGQDCRFGNGELLDAFTRQIEIADRYDMPYTLLLQYDAMINESYVSIVRRAMKKGNVEIGVWLENCRQLTEACCIEWRGRPGYDWDWFVNPDMLIAYSPDERMKLIDEVFAKFYLLFGFYPTSCGSWLMDAFSIKYLYEKYNVKAICICREQIGTDGYTLWGGYYNQAYYPSDRNMICPAQTSAHQIRVPVFRMLGPDPIAQYESGLDADYNPAAMQNVCTLEPACKCGKDPAWIDWLFGCYYRGEALSFAHTQAGQENGFPWAMYGEAFAMQYGMIDKYRKEGLFRVEKLSETGEKFLSRYDFTPATAMTALSDVSGKDRQSVWYNTKNYRLNVFRDKNRIGFRDAFLFDETYDERYLSDCAEGNTADYDNLPLLDGYRWSGGGTPAFASLLYPDGSLPTFAKIIDVSGTDETLTVSVNFDGRQVRLVCDPTGLTIQTELPLTLSLRVHTFGETTVFANEKTLAYSYRERDYRLSFSSPLFTKGECIAVSFEKNLKIFNPDR